MTSNSSGLIKLILFVNILYLLSGCSITHLQKKGDIENPIFHHTIEFTTAKGLLIIPVEIDGKYKNFLFDTGADASLIQRNSVRGKTTKVNGASNRKMDLGQEIVRSMKIGDINFRDTYAWNADLIGLKEQIDNFGGLIGQPIISKANWLIRYPLNQLEISNENLADDSYQSIEIKMEGGSPYTMITIDGKRYKAVVDLGSTASLSIPKDSKLAKKVLMSYAFTNNEREVYSLGGLQTIKEKVGVLPVVRLGNIEFKDVETDIKISSQLRIGIRFFDESFIYIDNINKDYKLKTVAN